MEPRGLRRAIVFAVFFLLLAAAHDLICGVSERRRIGLADSPAGSYAVRFVLFPWLPRERYQEEKRLAEDEAWKRRQSEEAQELRALRQDIAALQKRLPVEVRENWESAEHGVAPILRSSLPMMRDPEHGETLRQLRELVDRKGQIEASKGLARLLPRSRYSWPDAEVINGRVRSLRWETYWGITLLIVIFGAACAYSWPGLLRQVSRKRRP